MSDFATQTYFSKLGFKTISGPHIYFMPKSKQKINNFRMSLVRYMMSKSSAMLIHIIEVNHFDKFRSLQLGMKLSSHPTVSNRRGRLKRLVLVKQQDCGHFLCCSSTNAALLVLYCGFLHMKIYSSMRAYIGANIIPK